MYAPVQSLKSFKNIALSADEKKIVAWLKSAAWVPIREAREPSFTAKVPEFFSGVRLYRVQAGGSAGGSQGPLELFLKKLEYQHVIGKQEMHPLQGHGASRSMTLTKAEMDNLGIGRDEEDDEE